MKTGKESDVQVYRAVREYREKYSDKAVIYNTPGANRFGWPVLMAGGSLPALPKITISGFYESLANMKPTQDENYNSAIWTLKNNGESYLFFAQKANKITVDLSNDKGNFELFWINPDNGTQIAKESIQGKSVHNLTVPGGKETKIVAYIKKK